MAFPVALWPGSYICCLCEYFFVLAQGATGPPGSAVCMFVCVHSLISFSFAACM